VDPTDSYRHVIRVQGLTNSAVFGADGVCVFNGNGIGPNIKSFRKVIDSALRKAKSENRRAQAFEEYGTVYAPQVREQGRIVHERMASIAVSPDGKIHVAYVPIAPIGRASAMRSGPSTWWEARPRSPSR
jgi:hypothetical protein